MPTFMYIFRGVEGAKQELSPTEMAQVMSRWAAWAATFRARDAMKGGARLAPEGRVVDANLVVSDGPFAESKELVGGFFLVECPSLDAAVECAKACPGLDRAAMTVEIRPLR